MSEKEILELLKHMLEKLDQGKDFIKENRWKDVGNTFSQIMETQEKIKNNNPSVEALISGNTSFKKEYEPLKEKLISRTKEIISIIKEWRLEQTGKISGSKNLLDSLSKYYKPTNSSYYIDTKE